MSKYKISIDFEGMQEELNAYDNIEVEAEDECEAEDKVMDMLKKDMIDLPFFAVSEVEE